jgi:predicted  nucleic acid-binding Zn-ribbon protein
MEFDEDYYDEEYWENQPCESCPKCGRHYDDIDFDFQSCSKCGWDEENQKWDEAREPTEADYECGDADILTGRWN